MTGQLVRSFGDFYQRERFYVEKLRLFVNDNPNAQPREIKVQVNQSHIVGGGAAFDASEEDVNNTSVSVILWLFPYGRREYDVAVASLQSAMKENRTLRLFVWNFPNSEIQERIIAYGTSPL